MPKKILHLTLKKQWFDAIVSGKKKEEYRDMKPFWVKRLATETYDFIKFDEIHFRNGYSANAPFMRVEHLGTRVVKSGDYAGCFGLKLGRILEVRNYPAGN